VIAEKSILFSGAMVRTILAGIKTQTRRVVKPQPREVSGIGLVWAGSDSIEEWLHLGPYHPGQRLWVRETFSVYRHPTMPVVHYRADSGEDDKTLAWKPSIFMPRWASRITLEIVSVGVERVQEITEADTQAEGVLDFRVLWDSINEKRGYSFDSNPFVWIVSFQRVKNEA
jgi:hypothetical protein